MTAAPVLDLEHATLRVGARTLWSDLNLQVLPGEFVAVLGANGSGKTSLLRTVLGLQPLTAGRIRVAGQPVRRGSRAIGYVPQQRRIDPLTPLRARDLVGLGIDGHRWGPGTWGAARRARRAQLDAALAAVDALPYADRPVGQLSGGEQQRVRIAQALATDPMLLLCDEPLLSLDLQHQQSVTSLVDRRRRSHDTAVIFVTHEINPVLPYVDRVLYLAGGRFCIGTAEEVMTSQTLSALYGVPVEVIRTGNRLLVAGVPDEHVHEHDHVGAAEGT
jgi:zinc/manganese transport system ATP-binding protein